MSNFSQAKELDNNIVNEMFKYFDNKILNQLMKNKD